MEPGRLSLKARIILAIAAIAAIHFAFYAVPRWWYHWPRSCPEAYERAVGILKAEFGGAAVEKGIVSIPREAVALPHEGQALIYGAGGNAIFHVGGPDEASYLIVRRWSGGVKAKHISWRRAREIWAVAEYVTRAQCSFTSGQSSVRVDYPLPYGFTDKTWLHERTVSVGFQDPNMVASFWPAAPAVPELARDACRKALVRELSAEVAAAVDSALTLAAARAVVKASFPPRNSLDYEIIVSLADYYGEHAAKEDVAFLGAMDRPPLRLPPPLFRLPLVGAKLKSWDEKRGRRRLPDFGGYAWRIETLDGRSEAAEEGILIATAAVTNAVYDPARSEARRLLAEKWPDRWKALLADNYSSLARNVWYTSFDLTAGDRLTRLVAEDPKAPRRVEANVVLYEATKDKACIGRLEALARIEGTSPRGGGDFGGAMPAMEELVKLSAKEPSSYDVPTLVRELLTGMTDATYDCGHRIMYLIGGTRGDGCERVLIDAVTDPDRVFDPKLGTAGRSIIRRAALQPLMSRESPAAEKALLAYLEEADPPGLTGMTHEGAPRLGETDRSARTPGRESEETGIVSEVAAVMGTLGHETALPLVERALRRAPNADSREAIRRAIATLRCRCAADPAGYFLSIDSTEQRLVSSEALAAKLTPDELKALLADDRCDGAREVPFYALLQAQAKKMREEEAGTDFR